jgi:hypothetical protein
MAITQIFFLVGGCASIGLCILIAAFIVLKKRKNDKPGG